MLTIQRKIPWNNVNKLPAPGRDIPGVEYDKDDNCFIIVEVATAESLEEATNDAGGEEKLLDAYNDNKVNRALTNGRNLIRNAKEGTKIADLVSKAIKAVKEFSFATAGDRIGVKTKAENATSVMDYLKNLSADDLATLDVEALRAKVLADLMKR